MGEAALLFIGVTLVSGAGGFALARYLRGVRAILAWLLWLAAPFLLLGLLVFFTDQSSGHAHGPGMTPEHLHADAMFGIALMSMFIAPFWFVGNLVGGIAGLVVRRRKERG